MMYCCAVKKNEVVASAAPIRTSAPAMTAPAAAPAAKPAVPSTVPPSTNVPGAMIGAPAAAKPAPPTAPARNSNIDADEVIGE